MCMLQRFWLVTITLLVSDRERVFVVMQCWSIRLINVLCWLCVCPSVTDMAAVNYDDCQHYDPKIHRKLYQNDNPFIVRRYDGKIKKVSRVSWCVQISYRQTSVPHRTLRTVRVRSYQGLQTYSDSWTQHLLSLWSGVYTTPPSILLHVWCPTTSYDDESATER